MINHNSRALGLLNGSEQCRALLVHLSREATRRHGTSVANFIFSLPLIKSSHLVSFGRVHDYK